MSLFDQNMPEVSQNAPRPLAERMRPDNLEDYVGQEHLLGEGRPLRRLLEAGRPVSILFWGPPGTGKTTLARIISKHWKARFVEFSAVLSGVADIRRVVEESRQRLRNGEATVLFVDEIHRFNKAQQDAFLPHVESGVIVLLGATTENPSFEVIPALLSRCRVHTIKPLETKYLGELLDRSLEDRVNGLGGLDVELDDDARRFLIDSAMGDARRLLGGLEVSVEAAPLGPGGRRLLDKETVAQAMGRKMLRYDRAGDEHYDLISALHKSLRASDPDAALYWMYRMIEGGEDPHYILRRMVRFASEDIGMADPYALNQVMAALKSYDMLGAPEGHLAMAQAAVYLALAPKSNALYLAEKQVKKDIRKTGQQPVPLHARNAPTKLMKEMGYSQGYQYPHDYPDALVGQVFLPDALKGRKYYRPTDRGREKTLRQRLEYLNINKARLRKKEN